MSEKKTVLAIVGSLREASLNRQLAELAAEVAPEGVSVVVAAGLDKVPFYNQDLDTDPALAEVAALRETVAAADALLFVAPPNNGTISAVQKNVIDWISRPYGAGAIGGRPSAIVGAGGNLSTVFDDLERAITIAGGTVIAHRAAIKPRDLGQAHPRENADVTEQVRGVLSALVAADLQNA